MFGETFGKGVGISGLKLAATCTVCGKHKVPYALADLDSNFSPNQVTYRCPTCSKPEQHITDKDYPPTSPLTVEHSETFTVLGQQLDRKSAEKLHKALEEKLYPKAASRGKWVYPPRLQDIQYARSEDSI